MVPGNTRLTLDVKGHVSLWGSSTPSEIRGQVSNALTPYFQVYDIAIVSGGDNPLETGFGLWNWSFTAVVPLRTIAAYAESDDIAAVVANAFYEATGTVPAVTVRGYGVQQVADVDTSPSYLSLAVLAALAVIAIAVSVYIPHPR